MTDKLADIEQQLADVELLIQEKHLPGQHDQASHGRGGGSAAGSASEKFGGAKGTKVGTAGGGTAWNPDVERAVRIAIRGETVYIGTEVKAYEVQHEAEHADLGKFVVMKMPDYPNGNTRAKVVKVARSAKEEKARADYAQKSQKGIAKAFANLESKWAKRYKNPDMWGGELGKVSSDGRSISLAVMYRSEARQFARMLNAETGGNWKARVDPEKRGAISYGQGGEFVQVNFSDTAPIKW